MLNFFCSSDVRQIMPNFFFQQGSPSRHSLHHLFVNPKQMNIFRFDSNNNIVVDFTYAITNACCTPQQHVYNNQKLDDEYYGYNGWVCAGGLKLTPFPHLLTNNDVIIKLKYAVHAASLSDPANIWKRHLCQSVSTATICTHCHNTVCSVIPPLRGVMVRP